MIYIINERLIVLLLDIGLNATQVLNKYPSISAFIYIFVKIIFFFEFTTILYYILTGEQCKVIGWLKSDQEQDYVKAFKLISFNVTALYDDECKFIQEQVNITQSDQYICLQANSGRVFQYHL